ncbi:MAG: tail fiber domain-containing protein [Candidatus Anammoxibacter sp.]
MHREITLGSIISSFCGGSKHKMEVLNMKKINHFSLIIFVALFSVLSLRPSYSADVELTINSVTDGFSVFNGGSMTVARFMGSGLVGIGTSTPSAILHVVGSSSVSTALTVNGTMTVTGGNVGIGTTTPQRRLHVFEDGSSSFILSESTSSNGHAMIAVKGTNREYRIGVGGDSATFGVPDKFFVFDADASAMRMVIDTSGNVGIGTTTPRSRLEVEGSSTSSADSSLNITDSSGNSLFKVMNDGTVTVSGNVGIGTTTPQEKLVVNGTVKATTFSGGLTSSSVSISGGSITGITDLAVADGGTGASTASAARTNLVAAASGANSDITSMTGVTSITMNGSSIIMNGDSSTIQMNSIGGNNSLIRFDESGALKSEIRRRSSTNEFWITNFGPQNTTGVKLTWGATSWSSLSDKRLKENIKTIDNALEKVSKMRGVYFNLKEDEQKQTRIGVIAQEVRDYFPELVTEDTEGYLSMIYDRLGPILIEAIKGLKAENEALKADNVVLKAKMKKVEEILWFNLAD